MFVYSVRASAVRFVSVIVLSVIALVALVVFVPTYVPVSLFVEEESIQYNHINTPENRTAFLSQFGLEVDEAHAECVEVTIPARFDAVYEGYNAIQKEQGLNLERYRGKKVMRYTYPVTNYEGYNGTVLATLLVYKDKVIGGDVCSAETDGFLHGFKKQ
ncbi:MAG: DUF4830 domain-containing protein [Clostridia bacterium]|nr:DUF4830 domain-containing protein [Clostridia bacterium]